MKGINKKKEQEVFIDIDKILLSRNPKLYKKLPKFIINYIKKTIHQDEVNEFIKKNNKENGKQFLNNSFKDFKVYSEVYGMENMPESGKVIFVANHPIGSFDGLHIINLLNNKYGKVKAVVNDILLSIKSLNEFFVGVNKHGTTPREQVAELNNIFNSDYPVFFFPSGLVSRKYKGVIEEKEWQKTFISRAIKHKRDVVPVWVEGSLSKKFYNIAGARRFFKIKANLEMFYLVDEAFKQKGKTIKITIKKPISHKKFDKSKTHYEWAQEVRNIVYGIKS